MGIQLLFGYQTSVEALKNINNLGEARFNTLLYLGIEGSDELVNQSNKYFNDIGNPKNIGTVQSHVDENLGELFDENSVDLCVSRNFLMHLPNKDFEAHLKYVAGMLKPKGKYVFSVLNPAYEVKKTSKEFSNGEEYEFSHGLDGEYGSFYHYYKTQEYFDELINKHFVLLEKDDCFPVTDRYSETHTRYYDKDIPMARVYVLEVKK